MLKIQSIGYTKGVMLVLSTSLFGKPVGSIQAGHRVGFIERIVLDPHQLKVVAFGVKTEFDKKERILFAEDIVSFSLNGLIVQTNDDLMQPEGLVRFSEIEDIGFQITGKPVVQDDGARLGAAESFTYDSEGFFIQKIHVKPSGIRSMHKGDRIISRSQIDAVTDTEIVVRSGKEPVQNGSRLDAAKKILLGVKPAAQPSSSTTSE